MAITHEISELKKRALLAKQRMRMGYWQTVQNERTKKLAEFGLDNSETLELVRDMQRAQVVRESNLALGSNQDREDELFYEKVCKLLRSDEIITNPITKLMDSNIYDNLDEANRQRYILEISKKFCAMKARYYSEVALNAVL
ncbi:MAG: hypothetical protein FWE13_05970 [Firmicutes bacterium]|nr:hypothetical protein [Bacillota bacterium]